MFARTLLYNTMCDTVGRLYEKLALVTGGSSGIGLETAKSLAAYGAQVLIASKNKTKLKEAADLIKATTGNTNVTYKELDLGSIKSVRKFAGDILSSESRLDILVNNAGAVGLPDRLTEDGLSLTMQVNYFGTFLLTYLLLPIMKSSTPSRIINSVAGAMYVGEIDFNHWNDIGRYSTVAALGNSKLATAIFSLELSRRLKNTTVTVNSFDPFIVSGTGILENIPDFIKPISYTILDIFGQNKENVGKQVAYLAAEPTLESVSGQNYKFCQTWFNHWLVYDEELGTELWNETKNILKINED